MTWKARVPIHQDLRRLHEHDREADTSRELGYSSVTQGEGSLDLVLESGEVRYRYGDQPDGRFGLGIWHRGGLRFLPDLLESAEDRISETERVNGVQDGRLDGHDSTLASHDGRISGLGNRMLDAEGRLNGHDSTLSSHGARIGNVESKNSSQDTRLSNVESKNSSQDSTIAGLASRIAGLEGQDNASSSDVAALQSKLNSIDNKVNQIEAWLKQYLNYPNSPR